MKVDFKTFKSCPPYFHTYVPTDDYTVLVNPIFEIPKYFTLSFYQLPYQAVIITLRDFVGRHLRHTPEGSPTRFCSMPVMLVFEASGP